MNSSDASRQELMESTHTILIITFSSKFDPSTRDTCLFYSWTLTLLACTQSVDNLFLKLMVLWENQNFLTITGVKLCPQVILLYIHFEMLESIFPQPFNILNTYVCAFMYILYMKLIVTADIRSLAWVWAAARSQTGTGVRYCWRE